MLSSMRWLATCALVMTSGCAEEVDYTLPDYESWGAPTEVCGFAPGHGNSCRRIFVNDVARGAWDYTAGPGYPMGSHIIKEIRANNDGVAGDLSYYAIMVRDQEITSALEDEGGWTFVYLKPGDAPVYRSLCWGRCHVAAPFNGAFYDYRD